VRESTPSGKGIKAQTEETTPYLSLSDTRLWKSGDGLCHGAFEGKRRDQINLISVSAGRISDRIMGQTSESNGN